MMDCKGHSRGRPLLALQATVGVSEEGQASHQS
jgi:hypothetical protein